MALSRTAAVVSSVALALAGAGVAGADTALFIANSGTNLNGTIGEYSADTGTPINTAFVSPNPFAPTGVAVSGSKLFTSQPNPGITSQPTPGIIGEYNATTGTPINPKFSWGSPTAFSLAVSGSNLFAASPSAPAIGQYNISTGSIITYLPVLSIPVSGSGGPITTPPTLPVGPGSGVSSIATSGMHLFSARPGLGAIQEYNISTGEPIDASFVSGLDYPDSIAVSGTSLFVADRNGTIGKYNANTGAAINASLVSGLSSPTGIAVSGSSLFVSSAVDNTISRYDANTGAPINKSFITGLNSPYSIAIADTTQRVKVKLPDGSVYSVPLLSNIYDLKGFSVTRNGKQVDLNSLSSGTLSKLISYSQALSQMKNFDAGTMSKQITSEAASAKNLFDQSKWTNFQNTAGQAVIDSIAGTARDAVVCLATGPAALVCDAAAAALSVASATAGAVANGVKLNNDLAIAKLADNLGSGVANAPTGQDSSPLEQAASKASTLLNKELNDNTVSYQDFVNAYIPFEKVNAEANVALQLFNRVGVKQSNLLTDSVGSFATFGISNFLNGSAETNDSKQQLSAAQALVKTLSGTQLGAFGQNYIAYDQVLAACQGVTSGSCPSTSVGTMAKNAEPPPYAAAFRIQHPFHMTVKPTNFGQGTDPTYGGTYKPITLSDGTSAGRLTAGSSSTTSGSMTTMALAFSLDSVTPASGKPVSISSLIDTPSHAFSLSFGYRFLSESGYLKVLLNNVLLSTINAPATLRNGFSQYLLNVNNSNLWGLNQANLGFIYGGPSDSQLLFDNVQVSDASLSSVPEPGSLWIFLSGGLVMMLLASCQRRRRRCDH